MSSPRSFATAAESQSSPQPFTTAAPADADLPESPAKCRKVSSQTHHLHFYRPAKALPYELLNHAYVYFSDEGYPEAISLLTNLLEAGYGTSNPEHPLAAYIPPAQYIALLATLIVHPKYSTHAKTADAAEVCQKAAIYVQSLSRIVGPINADLAEIFRFPDEGISRRNARADSAGSENDDGLLLPQRIANSGSVWALARNFWDVVGWAFNCSVRCKFRWARWKQFLDVMLDVIEADWVARLQQLDLESLDPQERIQACEVVLQKSLFWSYIQGENPSSGAGRRNILRAIFANGSAKSRQLFKEIFTGESIPKKEKPQSKGPLKKIDLDENDFGDYDSEDDDDVDRDETPAERSRPSKRKSRISMPEDDSMSDEDLSALTGSDILGGADALLLRQRLVNMMSEASLYLPRLTTDRTELFDNMTEFLEPLPCSIYPTLLSWSCLPPPTQDHLNALLLFDIVSRSRPPHDIDISVPSIAHLKEHYLPQSAKQQSTADHAKVVVILETILSNTIRRMKSDTKLRAEMQRAVEDGSLRRAMDDGVRRREKRAIGDARQKGKGTEGEEASGRRLLDASTMRLRLHVDMLENSKCFGRRVEVTPQTPSRARYVLIQTPTPQRKNLFTSDAPSLSQQTSSSLSMLSDTPPVSSTPVPSDDGNGNHDEDEDEDMS